MRRLRMLRKWLMPAQRASRDGAFRDAERWLSAAREANGVQATVQLTFQNPDVAERGGSERIDVEVLRGSAFGRNGTMGEP